MVDMGDRSPSYRCGNCQTPIAFRSDLLSKNYVAKSGGAFMFSHAVNIIAGEKQHRELITGSYTVTGIYCSNCGQELGWKYLKAYQDRQKFKEGKFIIEKTKLLKEY
ncbi:hypothetical protein L6164_030298 [Bauhinia variegata]|uniref:Uncharacterized protein n=1 Tax=Bauhinia variegata TaxID=167791 RepID=A0ACB9LBX4_BAUVA|nr:hypothetical protein L6164_030298 [Bauhinia variegata]